LIQINGGHYLFLVLNVLSFDEVVSLDKSLGLLLMQIVLGLVPVVMRVSDDAVSGDVVRNEVLGLNLRIALRDHLRSVFLRLRTVLVIHGN
jgi:hypothetical protein